jgi:hypothetical protein
LGAFLARLPLLLIAQKPYSDCAFELFKDD